MSYPAFFAVLHRIRFVSFWLVLMSKISEVGILWFRQFLQDALFLFRSFFYALIEFVARGVFHFRFFEQKTLSSFFFSREVNAMGMFLCLFNCACCGAVSKCITLSLSQKRQYHCHESVKPPRILHSGGITMRCLDLF